VFLNVRLTHELDVGLLNGFLELDVSEMQDDNMSTYFETARSVVDNDPISIFTKHLTVFTDFTSILAQIATLATLTSRKSWPILALAGVTPLLDRVIRFILHRKLPKGICNPPTVVNIAYSYNYTMEDYSITRRKRVLNSLGRDVSARPELTMFGAKDWIVDQYAKVAKLVAALKEQGKLQRKKNEPPWLQRQIQPLLNNGSRALLYLIVAFQPDYFDMPISQLSFLESSIDGIFRKIIKLRDSVSGQLLRDIFKIRNLFECLEIKSKVSGPEDPMPYKSDPRGMKIEVRDLSFTYDKDAPSVLKNINFTVEPGQIVSIVGYNGSGILLMHTDLGKTTLIRLLTMLEVPTSGGIYINDINMTQYDPKVLRVNISTLFQDFRIRSISTNLEKYQDLSAQENIGLGEINSLSNLDDVKAAADLSGAHDFIRTFESYYATRLHIKENEFATATQQRYKRDHLDSTTSDKIPFMRKVLLKDLHAQAKARGKLIIWADKPQKKGINIEIPKYRPSSCKEYIGSTNLSGGQWQRVALSRAFMRMKEAHLLILDEPSSALDPQAEYEVFKSIMELRRNKTTIYIVCLLRWG
jgi:ABC-type multidrug transport system fused ATPase/permease subunit